MAIGGISNSAAASYAADVIKNTEPAKTDKTEEGKKTYTGGRTVGDPKLSDKAAKYYEELKKKFGDMDFVLVSKDRMADVKKNAAAYGDPNKTVVLIDEEKLERMATDEEYRKKYEGIISNGRKQLSELAEKMTGNSSIKGFGMQVNDNGTVSFFAAMEKGNRDVSEKMAQKRAEKKAEKKAHQKKEEKIAEKEKREKAKAEEKQELETVYADSIDELINKISDFTFEQKSDSVFTESELSVGGSIDYKG